MSGERREWLKREVDARVRERVASLGNPQRRRGVQAGSALPTLRLVRTPAVSPLYAEFRYQGGEVE